MSRARWAHLGLLAFGLGLGLGVAELVTRACVPVRSVGPSFSLYDSRYGKRLKRSFSAVRITPEATWRFTTNSAGFRGPEPAPGERRPILFLGDSFTEGYGVSDGEEFPALVRKALDGVPVVNAGIGDNGNGRWIRFLRDAALDLDPRLVVVQFCGNDARDNAREGLYALDDAGALVELPVPAPGFARRVQSVVDSVPGLSRLHLVGLLRELRWRRPSGAGRAPATGTPTPGARPGADDNERLTFRIVEEVLSICAERGWPVLAIGVEADGALPAGLGALLAAHGAAILAPPTKAERPDLYYTIDGHWNAAGHRVVAALVLEALRLEPLRRGAPSTRAW